jgi:tetratricopeptide (TPR) repeat protein
MNDEPNNWTEVSAMRSSKRSLIGFACPMMMLWLAVAGFVPNLRADNQSRWVAEGQAAVESWLRSGPDESLKDEFGDLVSIEGSGFGSPAWNIQGYDYLILGRTAHFTRGTLSLKVFVTEGLCTAPGETKVGTPVMETRYPGATSLTIFVSHPKLGPGSGHSLTEQTAAAKKAKTEIEQAWQNQTKQIEFERAVQRWGNEGLTAVESWLRNGTNKINALCGDFVCFQSEVFFHLDTGGDFGRGNKPSMRFTVRALFSRGYLPLNIIITNGRETAPGLTNVGTPVIDGSVESHVGTRILVSHPEICVPVDFQPQDAMKFLAAEGEDKLTRTYKLTVLRKQHAFFWMAAQGPGGGGETFPAEQQAELRGHPCTLELRADNTLVISNYPVFGAARRFITVPGNWSLNAQHDRNIVQFKFSVSGNGEVKPRNAACNLVYPNNFNPYSSYSPGLNMLCRDESGNQEELWFAAINPVPLSGLQPKPHFVTRPSTNRPPNWDTAVYDNPETRLREVIDYQRKLDATNNWTVGLFQVRLAEMIRKSGRLDEAETNLLQGLAVLVANLPLQNGDVADAFMIHAHILMDKHDLAGAETAAREAIEKFPPQHYRIREAYQLLNQVLTAEGKPLVPLPAIAITTNAVVPPETNILDPNSVVNLQFEADKRRQLYGNESTNLADTLGLLSTVLRDEGKLTEAETVRRENLAIRRQALGNEDPRVATSLDALGTILQRESKLAEAETSIREALAIRRKVFGDQSSQVLDTLKRLNEVLKLENKPVK